VNAPSPGAAVPRYDGTDETLEVLTVGECLRLLAQEPVGRVVFTDAALPAALPVNFVLVEDGVVFRTQAGGALDRAVRGAVVAFEADSYDARQRTGWTVLVVGRAEEVTDPSLRRAVDDRGLRPWATGHRGRMIKIRSDRVTGRRVGPARSTREDSEAAANDERACL
jgi:hypothetical protein